MLKRILVLDDNKDILDVIYEALLYEKFEVQITLDSSHIIQTAEDYHPDLILLDYHLSGADGKDICRQIKTHPLLAHTPVIICSAYIQRGADVASWECDDIIAKPFGLDELTAKVNNLILRQTA